MSEQPKTENPQQSGDNHIIRMQPTVSSNLKAYGYNFARMILRVKFKNSPPGVVYDVHNFNRDDFKRFEESDSRGGFYQLVIRKQPERWPVRKVEVEGWDGEEKRVCVEPLKLIENKGEKVIIGQGTQILNGDDTVINIECFDWSQEQEQQFARRVVACVNALVGIPMESLQFVVQAGLQAMGRMERRRERNPIPFDPSQVNKSFRQMLEEPPTDISNSAIVRPMINFHRSDCPTPYSGAPCTCNQADAAERDNVPDEPSLEEELATADTWAHSDDIPFDGKDDRAMPIDDRPLEGRD